MSTLVYLVWSMRIGGGSKKCRKAKPMPGLGFKGLKQPQPRKFRYKPMYYDPRKDEAYMEKRRLRAKMERRLDPLVHGETMYEKMTGGIDPQDEVDYGEERRAKLFRLLFVGLALGVVLFWLWF